MVYFVAFVLFGLLTSPCWFVAVALYSSTVEGHLPSATPEYDNIVAMLIFFASLDCFLPNPAGLLVGAITWAIGVACLSLPTTRKLLLFGYLMLTCVVERLAEIGVLELTK